jgi:hypothetical protein
MMTTSSISSELLLKISSAKSKPVNNNNTSYAYYEDQLNLFWIGIQRCDIYEGNIDHSIGSCRCCTRIKNDVLAVNNVKSGKAKRKLEAARI